MDKNKIKIIVSSALVLTTLTTGTAILNYKLKKDKVEGTLPESSIETITNFNNREEPITIEFKTEQSSYEETTDYEKQIINYERKEDNIIESNNVEENDEIFNIDKKISDICKKNNYSQEVKKYMTKMASYISNNYNSNYDVFKSLGFPDKEEFFLDFLGQIEHNKPNIVIFENGDKRYKKYQDELDYYGGAGLFVPSDNEIIVASYGNDFETCKVFFEELIHSTQDYSYSNEIDKKVYYSSVEGEPALLKCLFENQIDNDNYTYVIFDKDGDYIISGTEGTGDLINSKYYLGLLSITDYYTMKEYKEGNGIMPVLNKIKNDYGVNTENIYKCLCHGEDSTKEDIEKFEQVYCDCMKIKLNDVSSKEELSDLFNIYRFYRVQFGITCYDDNGKNIINEKISSYDNLDRLFVEKIGDYDLFNCDNNELVFNALMCKYDNSRSPSIEKSINNLYFEDNEDNIFIYSKDCDNAQMCNKETGAIININKSSMKTLSYSEKVVNNSMAKTY